MSTTGAPDISVIVELDNVLHGEVVRAQTMLARLLAQLRENDLERRAEVLVMYDDTEIRPGDAERIVTATTMAEHPFVGLAATKGLRYFSLKNEGARRAKGDLIVFVDSDCLPEAAPRFPESLRACRPPHSRLPAQCDRQRIRHRAAHTPAGRDQAPELESVVLGSSAKPERDVS